MDIEKLIERLYTKQQSYASYTDSELAHVLEDAITALSTLQDENEKLRAELEQVKKKNKYSAHDVALILSESGAARRRTDNGSVDRKKRWARIHYWLPRF